MNKTTLKIASIAIILSIGLSIAVYTAYKLAFEEGKAYTLDNMSIEILECIHESKDNFDYAIYLNEELVRQY